MHNTLQHEHMCVLVIQRHALHIHPQPYNTSSLVIIGADVALMGYLLHGLWFKSLSHTNPSTMHRKLFLSTPLDIFTFVFTGAGVFGVQMFLL